MSIYGLDLVRKEMRSNGETIVTVQNAHSRVIIICPAVCFMSGMVDTSLTCFNGFTVWPSQSCSIHLSSWADNAYLEVWITAGIQYDLKVWSLRVIISRPNKLCG